MQCTNYFTQYTHERIEKEKEREVTDLALESENSSSLLHWPKQNRFLKLRERETLT